MCGIVAAFSPSEPVSRERIEAATRILHHRGPDAQHVWLSDSGQVALGHARLSIIDLRGGDQPISNRDQTLQLVANGEFYDFERIRKELEAAGHIFKTHSDSEIALHLYERYGPQCLHHLRGEFAFTIWDEKNQLLFAARDRFGIKPLYWSQHGNTLYLASEVKSLFALGVPARWDWDGVYQFGHLLTTADRTLFSGVYSVPPGHYLLATAGQVRVLPYWDFNYPTKGKTMALADEQEAIQKFRHLFEEAVGLRLRADVPVACYLSGGIDSCAVLGAAEAKLGKPMDAFTLSFEHGDYDERSVAEEMAKRSGARFNPISICQRDLADSFADMVWHSEAFCINTHGVAKFLLSRAVRDAGYKVVLTGEGSDEITAGYPHFRRDMLLHNAEGQDPKVVSELLSQLNAGNRVSVGLLLPDGDSHLLDRVERILGYAPSCLEAFASTGLKFRDVISKEMQKRLGRRDVYRMVFDAFDVEGQLAGRDPVNQSLYVWSKVVLPNYILTILGDRMEMAHSIEGRLPFLDHHLVEFARTLPVPMKIRGMTEKYILREAAKPTLTETVYKRQKHPFLAPPAALSDSGPLYALMQDTLRGPTLAKLPFFDTQKVRALLDRLPQMDAASRIAVDPLLMGMMSACVLQERFALAT